MTLHTKRCHAFTHDALGDHDAVGLAALIRRKEVSPREVFEAALARCQIVNPQLNAVETLISPSPAQNKGPGEGIFAGVPTFIKDNVDFSGLPTRSGSLAVPLRPAASHDPFIEQYLSLGVVALGKSRLPEFGLNASTEYKELPPTCNPWHTDYSTGASSGGSAALVAAGVVPIAHANDGGGSIRIPASCCGLVGLKPSFGRLIGSRMARVLPIKLLTEGVLTRSVRDTAHFFYGAEQYYCNKDLPPIGLVEHPGQRSLRIGLVLTSPTGHPTDPQNKAAVLATARLLEQLGHQVEELPSLPFLANFAADFSVYWGLLAFSVRTLGTRIFGKEFDRARLDELTNGLSRIFQQQWFKTPLVLRRLAALRRHYDQAMEHFDVILSPVLTHPTPKLGYLKPDQSFAELYERLSRYVGFTPLNNVTGSPALSLPLAHSAEGLPIGVHFSGRFGDEKTLLELAFALEEAKPWALIHKYSEQASR